jgi:hypothetical protein
MSVNIIGKTAMKNPVWMDDAVLSLSFCHFRNGECELFWWQCEQNTGSGSTSVNRICTVQFL